jgi:hypothetical protein
MKIHVYDNDPRQFNDPTYPVNHGPFSAIAINLNKELAKLGVLSSADDADWVGFNSGLDVGFKYKDKKTFVINVWETSNTLPYYLLYSGQGQKIFGLSDQITNLWKKYGYKVETLYPGCDTEFWHQTKPKNSKFTFLHINSSNVRSGIDLTLEAFTHAFRGNPNVQLIVKDTNNSPQLNKRIQQIVEGGANIVYISRRMDMNEIRDLYSESHVCLNLIRITSFGLPLLECSACNCLCVTGDVPPTNEIIKSDTGVLVRPSGEVEFSSIIPRLTQEWGLLNCFPSFEYPEQPKMFDFNVAEYVWQLQDIYNKWDSYSKIDTRSPIVQNWSWEKSAKRLVGLLNV